MSKDINVALLYGYYGGLLNDHQQELMRMYYDCDMSLSEISEVTGVSRQGIRDVLSRASEKLVFCEAKLGYCKLIREVVEKMSDIAEKTSDNDVKAGLNDLIKKLKES